MSWSKIARQALKMRERIETGEVSCRRARETGATIAVVDNREDQLAADSFRWYTRCITHGDVAGHDTRREAEGWARQPSQWCAGCAGSLDEQ